MPMPNKGQPNDNSIVETYFKTLKTELIWRTKLETRHETKNANARYINSFCNLSRCHTALRYISPVQFERAAE
jgi:putative transposase